MSDWLTAVALGLVEGLTEFLPVSSTGHLLLAERFLTRQSDTFNVVIQAGAVLAVVAAFAGKLRDLLTSLHTPTTRTYLAQLAAAFLLTAVGGLGLKHFGLRLPESTTPVAWATLVGGILFIAVELGLKRRGAANLREEGVSWPVAIAQGFGQLVAAILPGSSRSGTTILLGLMLGSSRRAATEFSFLLGVPTLLAAAALELKDAFEHHQDSEQWTSIGIGSVTAAICAFVVVRWLLTYVQRHTFIGFGVYRIVLGLALLTLAPEHPEVSSRAEQNSCPFVPVANDPQMP